MVLLGPARHMLPRAPPPMGRGRVRSLASVGREVVVLSIHKRGVAGEGFRYLTRHVAVNDGAAVAGQLVTDYYAVSGNPPGHWLGQGLDALGRAAARHTRVAGRRA